jgi:5'-deoxynucleotidase YfbR-like HD superfamily hydrolase
MKTAEKSTETRTMINTWSGGTFSFSSPNPEDIRIGDIAHALSLQCRFNGHVNDFYSVAEHSVLVSDILMRRTQNPLSALSGLLHDAAEAYIGDVVSPLKHLLTEYLEYEKIVERCISARFGVPFPHSYLIREADKEALAHEFANLAPFAKGGQRKKSLSPAESEALFLDRFEKLKSASVFGREYDTCE